MHADDFGMSQEVNAAIIRAHGAGTLTSTTLMVGEPAYQDAIELAHAHPSLGVGLHLTVSCDHGVLPPVRASKILNAHRRFRSNPLSAGLLYKFSVSARAQLMEEMEAQFDRFASTGLPWSHVDGHQHMHMHPIVWDKMLSLCAANNIFRLRIPVEEFRRHFTHRGQRAAIEPLAGLILRMYSLRNLKKLSDRRTLTSEPWFVPDRSYGTLQSGNMHAEYLLLLLNRLGGRINEVYFHPGTEYARKLPVNRVHDGVFDVELDALLDSRVKTRLTQGDLKLATYSQAEQLFTNQLSLSR